MDNTNEYFMNLAIKQAQTAAKRGDVPVGAVIVSNGVVVAQGFNQKEKKCNATAHAEIVTIKKACKKLKDTRLTHCEMYVTFEPCLMCVGAILNARISKVYFGAYDKRFGACKLLTENNFNHICKYEGGLLQKECSALLTNFFTEVREGK